MITTARTRTLRLIEKGITELLLTLSPADGAAPVSHGRAASPPGGKRLKDELR
jgi:hypothetical protein